MIRINLLNLAWELRRTDLDADEVTQILDLQGSVNEQLATPHPLSLAAGGGAAVTPHPAVPGKLARGDTPC